MRNLLLFTLLACGALLACGDKESSTTPVDSGTATTHVQPTDADIDGDGYTVAEDCNAGDARVNPGAAENSDGLDNDCDGEVDEGVGDLFYADADGDGYGDPAVAVEACSQGDDYVPNDGDCDDDDPTAYPGAAEDCDGADDDCDGETDEDVGTLYFEDADGDGYGSQVETTYLCEAPTTGWTLDDTDCDDANSEIHPEAAEVPDGFDNDCDGEVDETD